MNWHTSAKAYLDRLCSAEYAHQRAAHLKRGKRASTFRYAPSEYVRELIDCLDRNDEETFKARKMLEGYASAAGI